MNYTNPGDTFLKTIENFIIICENSTLDFERQREKLNLILNDLNSFNFKLLEVVDVKEISESILRVLPNIPIAEDTILVKTFTLIVSLLHKHALCLTINCLDGLILFVTQFINKHKYVGVCDILKLLQTLFTSLESSKTVIESKPVMQLLSPNSILLQLIQKPEFMQKSSSCHYDGYMPVEIKLSALFCLEILLSRIDDFPTVMTNEEHVTGITKILLNILYETKLEEVGHLYYCALMRSAITSFRYIGFDNRSWCLEHLNDLLGICTATMLFGLPGFTCTIPQPLQPSQQALKTNDGERLLKPNKKGGKLFKLRKPRKTPQNKYPKQISGTDMTGEPKNMDDSFVHSILFEKIRDDLTTLHLTTSGSDSCPSDTESSQIKQKKARQKETKLRLASLSLLSIVAKNVDKRFLFGYWHGLFPTEDVSSTTVALLNCALRDSNQLCRMTALQATSLIVYGTRPYLMQADGTGRTPTTFTPFSVTLANRIRVMYSMLTQALINESSAAVLTQILKCLAVLIQATTFTKFKQPTGLIVPFVTPIRSLLRHKDSIIVAAALSVMEFLIGDDSVTDEISTCIGVVISIEKEQIMNIHELGGDEIVEDDDEEEALEEDLNSSEKTPCNNEPRTRIRTSWLLLEALRYLGVDTASRNRQNQKPVTFMVRLECLQLMLVMSRHFHWIKDDLELIADALQLALIHEEAHIQLRAARCLDVIANTINVFLLSQNNNRDADFDDYIQKGLQFWKKILPHMIEKFQGDDQSEMVKTVLCDACANIGVHMFERFERRTQINLVVLLTGLSTTENVGALVNATATRALAIFGQFPSLREDVCYIENTIGSLLRILSDDNVLVRIKCSWALANVTDLLVCNITELKCEDVSRDLLSRLFDATFAICGDTDKVRTHASRILGNLLRLVTDQQLQTEKWQKICMTAVSNLLKQATLPDIGANVKVKWNACYAVGNFLRNPAIFNHSYASFNWQNPVFTTVGELIVKCSNFKVRINGAAALAVPTQRCHYGQYFIPIWTAMLAALEQANHLTDFNEYNHRDKLLDQLCTSVAHLITNCTTDDLVELTNALLPFIDTTKQNWSRVINRMVPEKVVSLLAASVHLKELATNKNLSEDQKEALSTLSSCFVPVTEYDD